MPVCFLNPCKVHLGSARYPAGVLDTRGDTSLLSSNEKRNLSEMRQNKAESVGIVERLPSNIS